MTGLSSNRNVIGALVLVAVTGLTHATLLGFDFVYDDRATVVLNSFVAHPSNLARIADGAAFSGGVVDAERPVMVASVMFDRMLFGLNPAGHHAQSVFWHCLNVLLLAWVVLRMTGDRTLAWVAALMFAILPAHAEAVAVVSYREDLLATSAVLGALIVLLRGGPGLLALLLAFLGVLAKESAVLVVLIWPLVSWIGDRPRERWRGAGWLAVGIGLAVSVRLVWSGLSWAPAAAIHIPDRGGLLAAAGAVARVALLQLGQLVAPLGLGAVHPDPPPVWPGHIEWLGIAAVGAGLAVAVHRRADRLLVGGAAITLVGMCPLLVWWRLPNLWADRFLYIPSLGFSLIAARLLVRFASTPRRFVVAAVLTLAVAALHLTAQHGFRDDNTIWSRAARVAPEAPRSWQGLALVRLRENRPADARRAVERGLSLEPDHPSLLGLAGVLACMDSDRPGTSEAFARAHSHPRALRARLALQEAGCALRLRQFDQAIELSRLAAAQAPWSADPHLIRGLAHQAKGELGAAEAALRDSVEMDPDRRDLWAALVRYYLEIGATAKALEARERAPSRGRIPTGGY